LKASRSTARLVDRLAHDPEKIGNILRRHFGFARRDLFPRRIKGSGVGK